MALNQERVKTVDAICLKPASNHGTFGWISKNIIVIVESDFFIWNFIIVSQALQMFGRSLGSAEEERALLSELLTEDGSVKLVGFDCALGDHDAVAFGEEVHGITQVRMELAVLELLRRLRGGAVGEHIGEAQATA